MITRNLLIGIAAATLMSAPALAAPPAASTTPSTVSAPATTHTAKAAKPAHVKNAKLNRAAQTRLKGMNLYSGPVDGRRSATFVKSVESFQRDHEIKATGHLDAKTRKALGV